MRKSRTKYELSSFGSGLNLPVCDINCLVVETYLRMSGNAFKVVKVNRLRASQVAYFPMNPLLRVPPLLKVEEKDERKRFCGMNSVLKNIRSCRNLTLDMELSPSLQVEHEKMVKFLHLELFPVVVYYWFMVNGNYSEYKSEISKQIRLTGIVLLNWIRRGRICDTIKSFYCRKYLKNVDHSNEIQMLKKFRNCLTTISGWFERKQRLSREFLLSKKKPMMVDVLLYSLLSCIYYPPFDEFLELKYLLKGEDDIEQYLQKISKRYFEKNDQRRPTFHSLSVEANIENKMIVELVKESQSKRKKAVLWMVSFAAAFGVYCVVRKKIPYNVFSPVMWIQRLVEKWIG